MRDVFRLVVLSRLGEIGRRRQAAGDMPLQRGRVIGHDEERQDLERHVEHGRDDQPQVDAARDVLMFAHGHVRSRFNLRKKKKPPSPLASLRAGGVTA